MAEGVILSREAFEAIRQVVRQVLADEASKRRPKGSRGGNDSVRWLGKTTADHAQGITQDIDIYSGDTKGSETLLADLGPIPAYNRFSEIKSGNWVFIEFIDGGYEIYAADPCADAAE